MKKNYLLIATVFIVAFIQFYLGQHNVKWGYISAFIFPTTLYLLKFGFSFNGAVRVDEEDNLELDDVFVLILLSITLDLTMYFIGIKEYS